MPGATADPAGRPCPTAWTRCRPSGDVLVICKSGARSMRAAEFLAARASTPSNVAGGTMAWIDAGRPIAEATSQGDRVPGRDPPDRTPSMTEFDWIADDEALADVVDVDGRGGPLRGRHRVPPRAHLLPAAWPWCSSRGTTRSALVDPLAVDLAAARQGARGPGIAVMHAAGQDLEVLDLACGTVPDDALRHPAGRRLRRLRHAVAGRAGRAVRRRPPAQGRPPHRLAAPPARRRPAPLRRVRRRPPASRSRTT